MSTRPQLSPKLAILGIIMAQLLGCTLWFSINAVADVLIVDLGLAPVDLGALTAAVQIGFISGTLILGFTGLADHFPA